MKRGTSAKTATNRETGIIPALDVRHLRAFVTLVEKGNMTATAEHLGVAQSTVSEAVTALERSLGTPAMTRRRGIQGADLTPAGQALLPYAQSILAALEDAHVAIAGVARDVAGTITIIANESISTYLLPPALGMVRKRWPNIRFAVTVGMCQGIYEGLATGRYDVGLMLLTPDSGTADETPRPAVITARTLDLRDVPLVVFCGASHPLAKTGQQSEVSREELAAEYPIFVSDTKGYFYTFVHSFFSADGATRPRLESTGSIEAVKRSVLANPQGIGVLSKYSVAEILEAGLVQQLHVRPAVPPLRLQVLLHRTRDPMHPATADLLEALRTVLDEHGVRPCAGGTPRRSTRLEKSGKLATNASARAQSPSHR